MQMIKMNGRMEQVFVLKDDIAATVVIPLNKLQRVDYQRLSKIEAKGGEMMKNMRDSRIDNGNNALKQYENLIVVVKKPKVEEPVEEITVQPKPVEYVGQESEEVSKPEAEEQPKRRGRGRPPKNA